MAFAGFDSYAALGNQPCNGADVSDGSVTLNVDFFQDVANLPIYFNLCCKGSGTTVGDIYQGNSGGDLTVDNPGAITAWSQSGNGYQVLSVNHATNYVRLKSSSVSWMPGNNSGFTYAMLIKVAMSYADGVGLFERVSQIAGVKTRTKGFGLYVSGTNLRLWIDSTAKNVEMPVSNLGSGGNYALITCRWDGSKLYLRVDSAAGSNEASTTGLTATTLDSTTNLSDFIVGGATDIYVAGVAQGTPGLACCGGAVVYFANWNLYNDDALVEGFVVDPFVGVKFPRGRVLNLEDPQEVVVCAGSDAVPRTRFSLYIHENYDNTLHYTVIDFPGTPTNDMTAQNWLDSTLGATSTGTPAPMVNYAENGGPSWPAAMAAVSLPLAVVAIHSHANGGGFIGGASTQNQSMQDRRTVLWYGYMNGITANPLSTANRNLCAWTGWSYGGVAATACIRWSALVSKAVDMHSLFLDSVAPSQTFNSLGGSRFDRAVHPTLLWGQQVQDGSDPSGAAISEANGNTVDWANNAIAKTIDILLITGLEAADGSQSAINLIDTVEIPLMAASGYNRIRHKRYSTGRDSLHSKGRDLIVTFLKYGFSPFFAATQIISDDGDGMV